MGASESAEEKEERERDEAVFDTRYISWDEHGNIRYGLVHPVKRSQQLKEILKRDYVDDEDGKVWYIMDSAWISSWLAYVQFDRNFAPAPGPCDNRRLLTYDYNEKKYIGRKYLLMARQDFGGDYRRVSKEVWELFKEYYPGSGPGITMTYNLAEKNEKGRYDTSQWMILDHVDPPPDTTSKKKTNFIKLPPISFKSNKDKTQQESNKTDGTVSDLQPTNDLNAKDSTSLLSRPLSPDAPNTSTISALTAPNATLSPKSTKNAPVHQDHQPDSDDDLDISPLNIPGKVKNEPKVARLSVNYSMVGEEKKDQPLAESNKVKRDSFFENVYFNKD